MPKERVHFPDDQVDGVPMTSQPVETGSNAFQRPQQQQDETSPNAFSRNHSWDEETTYNVLGKRFDKSVVVFFCQFTIISTVILVSIVNLSLPKSDPESRPMWIALLSSCLGYLLPNPSIKHPRLNGSKNHLVI